MLANRVTCAGITAFLWIGLQLHGDSFKLSPQCKFPPALSKDDSFSSCGNDGVGKNSKLEDDAKNNFCADMSKPVTVTFQTLKDMQKKSPDRQSLKTSRAALHNFFSLNSKKIGEGTVVRLVAFMHDAHISDCSSNESGEDVNCKRLGMDSNDFHIPLADPSVANPRAQSECLSVTAEMSPHFRPAAWNDIDLKTPTKNPVRITGPLFFDSSHTPCEIDDNGKVVKTSSPQRATLWEIHPVYELEVCSSTDPQKCDVNSNDTKVWTPYSKWIATHAAQTQATGKSRRSSCQSAAKKNTND